MADPTLEQAVADLEAASVIPYTPPSLAAEGATSVTVYIWRDRLKALLSAHTRHLAQGEGLDWDAAGGEAASKSPSGLVFSVDSEEFRAALNQQHRVIVGALREELARSEARVREYERLSAEYKTVAKALGVDGYGPEDFAEHIRTLNEEAP